MISIPEDRFKEAYDAVERLIEARWGIPVIISDVLDPNTGDFDGSRIHLDHDQDLGQALFVLVHLFGHTVQWNVSAEFRALGQKPAALVTEHDMAAIAEYERDATRYSLALLHEAGVTDLDQWVSDAWAADWRYLQNFYRTGEQGDFARFATGDPAELLTPKPIPEFRPERWVSRWAF